MGIGANGSRSKTRSFHFDAGSFFICAFCLVWLAFCISVLIDHSVLRSWIYKGFYGYDYFMDFFNSVHDAALRDAGGAYNSIYLPIVNLVYGLLAVLAPDSGAGLVDEFGSQFRDKLDGQVELAICSAIAAVLIAVVAYRLFKGCGKRRGFFAASILLAVPTLYAFLRGNDIVFCLVFVLLFVLLMDSDKPLLRHLGLLSLACAACVKIFPVLFGFLLIRRKRWNDVGWAALYSAILAFIPFFAFDGFGTFAELVDNIVSSGADMALRGYGFGCSITNTVTIFCAACSGGQFTLPTAISYALKALLLCSIPVAIASGEDWKSVTMLGLIVLLFPDYSFTYNIVFLLPGLALFLKEKSRDALRGNLAYLVLFCLCILPVPFGTADVFGFLFGEWHVSAYCLVSSLSLLVLWALLVCDGIRGIARSHATARLRANRPACNTCL